MKNVAINDDKASKLNLNYENFEKKTEVIKLTFFIRAILSSSVIIRKNK